MARRKKTGRIQAAETIPVSFPARGTGKDTKTPRLGRSGKILRALLRLLLVLALAAAVYAGLRLWRIEREAARSERLLQALRAEVFPSMRGDTSPGLSADTPPAQGGAHVCPVDWRALWARCPGAAAWLSGCGGEVDTPVMQGADNIFYLTHLADGTENALGAAFLDSANRANFADDQSFIFGHHAAGGRGAFAPLLNYRAQDYFDAHPAFLLHTPQGCFAAEIFASCAAPGDFPYYTGEFSDTAARLQFLQTMQASSDILSPTLPAADDRILTLCTCVVKSGEGESLRYLVSARLTSLP